MEKIYITVNLTFNLKGSFFMFFYHGFEGYCAVLSFIGISGYCAVLSFPRITVNEKHDMLTKQLFSFPLAQLS